MYLLPRVVELEKVMTTSCCWP